LGEHLLLQLSAIVVLGAGAQWIAWRINLPSILLLLLFGIAAGPWLGWIRPDELFGPVLLPAASLAVALILYEGGLTLRMAELPKVGAAVRNLVTLGAALTLAIIAVAAHWILGLPWPLAALLGAVLSVTGPTVITPLLLHIRPKGPAGPILKWEGIVIDPIGAMLAVLVFETIELGATSGAGRHALIAVLKTVLLGGGIGFAMGMMLTLVLARHWIADHLENAISLMMVVAAFALANQVQHESGLLAVTVMGFTLANQKWADVQPIVEFKENLRVLLISALFIVLAARLEIAQVQAVLGSGLILVAVLILLARPLSAWICTMGARLAWRQRALIAWMAPRGIVAAAVASLFAFRLEERLAGPGDPAGAVLSFTAAQVQMLVPITFVTIIATVAVYGLSAPLLARWLGVAEANPQGVLFVGAPSWARQIALLLQREGIGVMLADTNRDLVREARMKGLPVHSGSVLSDSALDRLDLGGLGRLIAATPNNWVNVLSVQRFRHLFGKANCYQLATQSDRPATEKPSYAQGRIAFGPEVTFAALASKVASGFVAKATKLSEQFDYDAFLAEYGEGALPLFVINGQRNLTVLRSAEGLAPEAGDTLICLVPPEAPARS
jgi:NhaP-type Na+/H+ or K+/H+ antiporter